MKPRQSGRAHLLLLLTVATCLSCSSTGRMLKPGGDIVKVRLTSGESCAGELLVVRDSTLVLKGTEPQTVSFREVRDVTIRGYRDNDWIPMVVLFEVIPVGLLGAAASSRDSDLRAPVALVALIPAVLTSIAYGLSAPAPPRVMGPLTPARADELRKYARFPLGLEENRLQEVLREPTRK